MENYLMYIGSWNAADYEIIMIGIAALFMGFSLLLRMCCVHKKAIDLTLVPVVSISIATVIKLFQFEVSLIYASKILLLVSGLVLSVYILIDNAAASLSVYDKPKQRVINLLWCILFFTITGSLLLL